MARSRPLGGVTALVAHVRDVYASRITGEATLPARPGSYGALPTDLDARLRVALLQRGMQQLYTPSARGLGGGAGWAAYGDCHPDGVWQNVVL